MTAVDTHLLIRALVDELARSGVRTAVTSPGSRNTPIIEALLAESRIVSHSHLDERAGGFYAVGAARASGLPVAVTVTSGTAVANLAPAVIEASEGGVPLIVLSADRPAELRQIGAGQTIDQLKIFGAAVRRFAELDLSEASPERMRWIRSLACRAVFIATGPDPGPVHLNLPLREPLVVDGPLPADPPGGEGRSRGRPWVECPQPPASYFGPGGGGSPPVRTVIVAGQFSDGASAQQAGAALAGIAARNHIPLLADPLSNARRGPAAIAHYDLILRDPHRAEALAPELVIRVGELPTSKPLRTWLAGLDVEQQVFHSRPVWPDPDSRMSRFEHLSRLVQLPQPRQPDGWLAQWSAADAAAADAISAQLGATGELTEPRIAALLGAELPAEATLYVAASMPIRDVEEFIAVRDDPPRVLANRGANGIDGTVSAAFGAAAVSAGPVVLLIGDVALAHDIGGLLAARRTRSKLTIVLIDNDGGGIFHFLPIAGHAGVFDPHVSTPHGLDFRHAAALYGLDHVPVTDVGGFTAALQHALSSPRSTIIEVSTDRAANRQLHADIAAAAVDRLSRPAPGAEPRA